MSSVGCAMSVEQLSERRSPEGLSVSPCSAGPRLVVVVVGEADWSTADGLRTGLASARAYGPRSIVLDLTDLSFCNLQGLRAMLAAMEAAQQEGVEVTLHGMSRQFTRLYDLYREGCGSRRPRLRSVRPVDEAPVAAARGVPIG